MYMYMYTYLQATLFQECYSLPHEGEQGVTLGGGRGEVTKRTLDVIVDTNSHEIEHM